jgi:hypothetical protein
MTINNYAKKITLPPHTWYKLQGYTPLSCHNYVPEPLCKAFQILLKGYYCIINEILLEGNHLKSPTTRHLPSPKGKASMFFYAITNMQPLHDTNWEKSIKIVYSRRKYMESQWPTASAQFSPLPEHSLETYLFMSLFLKILSLMLLT